MRLLLIANDFPNPGEPTKGIFNCYLARALALEHDIRVISPIPWVEECHFGADQRKALGPDRQTFVDGVEVHYPRYYYPPKLLRTHYGWFYWHSVYRTVRRLIEAQLPDAVLGYWAHPDGEVAVRVARMFGLPSVVKVGGSDVLLLPRQRRRRQCVVRVLQGADVVLTVSHDLRAKVLELGTEPEKVHVWRQGVDLERFRPGDRVEARRRLGIPAEGRALLWVGRMVAVKALDVLLEACLRLRDSRLDYHLYLVGDGPLRKSLESECRTRGLTDAVSFVGSQLHDRLPDWYRAADLTLLPSWSEGVPNVLRESLACGTRFVATRVGGIPEIAAEPAKQLVAPGDAAALAEAVIRVLAEPGPTVSSQAGSTSWQDSARDLVRILQPLVQEAHEGERPWWSGRSQPSAPSLPTSCAWSWRQLLRTSMRLILPRRLFLVRGRAQSRSICLTFDDGPHPAHTPRLLGVLKRCRVRATFFIVGRMAERYPDLVRRIAAEGHGIANHSFYHADPSLMSAAEVVKGVRHTNRLLVRLLGTARLVYRPPHGKLSVRKLLGLWLRGYTVVLWSVDPKDYGCHSADELRDSLTRQPLRGGDILLLHDWAPYTTEVLPELIERARKQGLEFALVSDWCRGGRRPSEPVRSEMRGFKVLPLASDLGAPTGALTVANGMKPHAATERTQ
jgi:glycosyltransferase involved in cell wall biosynthesis/peptidoglycan/xylan/chitin deacetylase (PgdA/CDA1 family)